jgi:hypothetical protein
MGFEITPSPRGYDDLFAQMLAAVPPGSFYDFTRPVVPWVVRPITFILTTDRTGVPIHVTVQRLDDYAQGVDQANVAPEAFFAADNPENNFAVTLGRGRNRLIATEQVTNGRSVVFEVIASENCTILDPMAIEIFRSVNIVNNETQAIFSNLATRLLDQVINFQDLLTNVQSLQILSEKLLVRSQIHYPGTKIGNRNMIEAFTFNTPVMIPQRQPTAFNIETSKIMRLSQNQAGLEAHVWWPNLAVTRWLAFIKMANSFNLNFDVLNIRDDLVEILYKGIDQLHQFNYDAAGSNFLTNLSSTNCFDNIEMSMSFQATLGMPICMWSYPFDEFITPLTPIGRGRTSFDLGVPLDSNLPFDTDPVDPWNDGWVGWSLTGRFDDTVLRSLDSSVVPSATFSGPACSYTNGPYTQMFNSTNSEIDINYLIGMNDPQTFMDNYTPGPVVGLDMDILVNGPLTVGVPVLAAVKFSDANHMTGSPVGSGTVTVQESNGGATTLIPVATGGFQFFMLTPTRAGSNISWSLSSGPYTGISKTIQVLAGPFAGLSVGGPIGNKMANVPFPVTVQATDIFGNPITNVGANVKVTISLPLGGFTPGSLSPLYVDLVNGVATVNLTIAAAGSGTLEFALSPADLITNTFTVT